MRAAEIGRRYVDFFAARDHTVVPSASLLYNDPTLLFVNAGMVPFKPYFTGAEPAPFRRAVSLQKCVRTLDIEDVGKTTRHGTFFQMCGNFSFGDYFKEGAIDLAWGLLTSPQSEGGYGLDGDRIWVTIWENDDVSYDSWTKTIGLDPKHVVKLTREEIFWSTGQPGPAGPCAEIHYDRGPDFGPEAIGGTVDPGGDRYLEIWNLVFTQYNRTKDGKYEPLAKKNIDTGCGLERLASVIQQKESNFETDLIFPIIEKVIAISGGDYNDPRQKMAMKVIADHIRAITFMISDGILPSNEGRGYVLRRILRRAVRFGRLLGISHLPVCVNGLQDLLDTPAGA